MSIKKRFSCDSNGKPKWNWFNDGFTAADDGNPDKYRFTLVRRIDFDKVAVVEINYPDCKNHKGNKIFVYEDSSILDKGLKDKCLDPHFLKIGNSPVARFEPLETGWIYAISFAKILTGNSHFKMQK